jgi:hypothetical protein
MRTSAPRKAGSEPARSTWSAKPDCTARSARHADVPSPTPVVRERAAPAPQSHHIDVFFGETLPVREAFKLTFFNRKVCKKKAP